jgi:hypothetical protein
MFQVYSLKFTVGDSSRFEVWSIRQFETVLRRAGILEERRKVERNSLME